VFESRCPLFVVSLRVEIGVKIFCKEGKVFFYLLLWDYLGIVYTRLF